MPPSNPSEWVPPPQRGRLDWAAVDLDGTLAKSEWTPDNPSAKIGEPMWPNIEKVRRLKKLGMTIVIHTARPWADYEQIQFWAAFHGVPIDHIVCGKLLAAVYIDDRNVQIDSDDWSGGRADGTPSEPPLHPLVRAIAEAGYWIDDLQPKEKPVSERPKVIVNLPPDVRWTDLVFRFDGEDVEYASRDVRVDYNWGPGVSGETQVHLVVGKQISEEVRLKENLKTAQAGVDLERQRYQSQNAVLQEAQRKRNQARSALDTYRRKAKQEVRVANPFE